MNLCRPNCILSDLFAMLDEVNAFSGILTGCRKPYKKRPA
jgi:hypothetical protein